ncbi:hypothetical protein MUK60_10145 [Streptomyces sp. LRE541]|uniref:hypothetical protein n=1 Tax=Streptomyces sp. LRE541 TaxID=2931983 RepID=UPI00200C64CE|nr:hypothetical protein [Streptomyces sp. LRE541]UPZ28145.1 hypothetical protein MUK60_10145 [Streptomyces sp. LRE541]
MTFTPVDGSVSGPKQPEDPTGYGTRYGGRVAVQGGRWACSGCGRSEAADDPHHAAQHHGRECLAVSYT